ncbi:MAG: hypothetical protein QM657_15590 [Lacrimispora sp.]|uniref:hypothetical protein n=1 Tax=Lacrimispora sp. TaxID=2719234 RepID=UPI0039E6EDE0
MKNKKVELGRILNIKKNLKGAALKILSTAVILSLFPVSTVFAGQWTQDSTTWKYQNDDGSYAEGWNWIDGKSYYFDSNGNMLANTTTPDGFTVNTDGAWVVNDVVQTQNSSVASTTNTGNHNSQYPLKGYLEPWFVIHPELNHTVWKNYDFPWVYVYDAEFEGGSKVNVPEDKSPFSLSYAYGTSIPALAKLTDYQITGWGPLTPADEEKYAKSEKDRAYFREYINSFDWKAENDKYHNQVDRMAEEIRKFLNSFDWKNASDYEKAVQIARRITQADYLNEEGTQYAYSCLVEGKANCSGYTDAANTLAICVGLPASSIVPTISHVYPIFLVDGIWLDYEPTTKSATFSVANVWTKNYEGEKNGTEEYQPIGEFCKATGYEMPTIESVEAMFPGSTSIGWYAARGRGVFIHFENKNSPDYEYLKKLK